MATYSAQVKVTENHSSDAEMPERGTGINPFPGLRPFTIDECHLFFGRESQVDEILVKLSDHKVVTVMGYSGSGKSSLMYCGLVPVLYGGFMTETGPHWQVVTIRPGNSPINNLANSLVDILFRHGRIEEKDRPIHHAIFTSVLRRGVEGLVEVAKFLQLQAGENIFFLVDQFEELFRFKESGVDGAEDEAALYVNLILTAVQQKEIPVYIAINMRSDFIGDCSAFAGLTQVINDSNYLVPQMTREQKRMAIEGPVAVGGGKISQRLVKRLLNDVGDNQDQLPILQHALMRTWDYWISNHDQGEAMDIRHYNAVGRITQALSLHANEAFDELTAREKEIAEVLFKNITEKNIENQGMRRPGKIRNIAVLADAPESDVIKVIEHFRQPGRSFLMPGVAVRLHTESVVELSHESLMRIWTRLSTWVEEEFDSANMYHRISDAAAMYQIGKTGLWRPPDLQLALNWQKKQRPTRAWAQRYDVAFERAIVFMDTSRITYDAELKNQEMRQRKALRRAWITNVILGVFLAIAIMFFLFGLFQKFESDKNALLANEARKKAEVNEARAIEQEQIAKAALAEVRIAQKQIAAGRDSIAQQYSLLESLFKDLNYQKALAERSTKLAIVEATNAKVARDTAIIERQHAVEATDAFKRQLMLSIAQQMEAKSIRVEDPNLAGLIAMQGYLFHVAYGGKKYDPTVFTGLYYAIAKLSKLSYNAIKTPGDLKNRMYALAISEKKSVFYTSGSDGQIYEGDYLQQKMSTDKIGENNYPNRVLELSKDEKYLVNGSDSSFIQIFNLDRKGSRPLKVKAHTGFITDIRFMPDNSGFISASSDLSLTFTNHLTGESKVLLTLPYVLKSIDIDATGTWLAGASPSGQLVIVDLRNNTSTVLINEAPNRILSVAFHPTRTQLAYGTEVLGDKGTATRGVVKMFDYAKKKFLKELGGHRAGVSDVAFSPDGLLLASAGLDKKLQMYVVDKEEDLPVVMDNNNGNIWSIKFSKGSDYLLASCNAGEIRIWPTDPRTLAKQICPKLKKNMTLDEWEKYVGNKVPFENTCQSKLIESL